MPPLSSIIGHGRTLSCSVSGRVPPGGHKGTIEYTAAGQYIFPTNAPAEIRDRFPEEISLRCEYSEGKVTHFYNPDRRAEFVYTIEEDNLLIVTALSDGSIWKLERSPEKIR